MRRAIADRSVCAVSAGRSWLVLGWKFDGDELLPCMGEVIAAIPDGTPALTVERLMTPPSGELNVDGPISPGLAAGRACLVRGDRDAARFVCLVTPSDEPT